MGEAGSGAAAMATAVESSAHLEQQVTPTQSLSPLGVREAKLEHLLGRHDPLTTRDRASRQFSSVVFPACVPPAMTILSPAATAASRNAAA